MNSHLLALAERLLSINMKVYQQAALGHLAQASYGKGIAISKAAWAPGIILSERITMVQNANSIRHQSLAANQILF
jgi:hypothetical protein